jgi:L-ascorbate metabolism protein UlaG (beta-lactamase superfamily)
VTGTVTGFFLRADAPPSVYVSGDNASLDLIAEIDGRLGPAEVSLLNCGGARAPDLLEGYITLTAESAVEAARGLRSDHIVPLHFEGWSHYSQDREDLRAAFAGTDVEAGLELLKPGETLALD